VILTYDITKPVTFYNVDSWLNEVEEEASQDIVKMLIGTKLDLVPNGQEKEVPTETAKLFAQKHNMMFYEVSALTGQNIEEAVEMLVTRIVEVKRKQRGDKKREDS
jgi:GTPase SAR1 family protein